MSQPSDVNDIATQRMFDALLAPVKKRMKLNTFQTKFLPFLSSIPIPAEDIAVMIQTMERKTGQRCSVDDLHANLLNEWLDDLGQNIGIGYVEVDVVDADGTVVYTVPPLLDNSEDVLLDDINIAALTEQAINQSKVLPAQGIKFINTHILPFIRRPEIKSRYIDMWNKIYTYHGLPLITSDGTVGAPSQSTTESDIQSFEDYGD